MLSRLSRHILLTLLVAALPACTDPALSAPSLTAPAMVQAAASSGVRYYPGTALAAPVVGAPSGERSTALPWGWASSYYADYPARYHVLSRSVVDTTADSLRIAQSTSALISSWPSDGAPQVGAAVRQSFFAGHSVLSLGAQVIPAGSWTVALGTQEGARSAEAFTALSLYVWRPSTQSVVGVIYDAAQQLGAEFAFEAYNNRTATRLVTVAGSSVETVEGDLLVLELWGTAQPGRKTVAMASILFGAFTGQVDATADGQAAVNHYLLAPAQLIQFPQ